MPTIAQLVGGGDNQRDSVDFEKSSHIVSKHSSGNEVGDGSNLLPRCGTSRLPTSCELSGSEFAPDICSARRNGHSGRSVHVKPCGDPFEMFTFPWIELSLNDSRILRQHAQKLLSDDFRDVEETCHVLVDLLFQDFPAEIFLQRPVIVQALLRVLESKTSSLPVLGFAALTLLTTKLIIRFHQICVTPKASDLRLQNHESGDCSIAVPDPTSFPKSSFASMISSSGGKSSNSSPGSSRSADVGSSSLSEPVTMESAAEISELTDHQMPLPVYLCVLIDCCLDSLKESIKLGVSRPLLLLDQVCRLIRTITNTKLWMLESDDARMMAEHLLHAMQEVGNRILYHLRRTEGAVHQAKVSRLIYTGLTKIAFVLVDLVPFAHFHILPDAFRACLPWICQDEALALSYPTMREKFLLYLKEVHQPGYEVYVDGKHVCAAMSCAYEFIHKFAVSEPTSFMTCAEKALQGLSSLVYHESSTFIRDCVLLCSHALGVTPENPKPFVKLFVRLLSYSNSGVRKQIYVVLFDYCASFLNVAVAADPMQSSGCNAVFLMYSHILREIVLYGLFETETKPLAQCILALVTQKFLINNVAIWKRLRSAVKPLFAAIFVHADLETDFGRRVISWTQNQPEHDALFDSITRYRAAFSLMFHPNRLVRGHASELILQRLSHIQFHGDSLMPGRQYVFEKEETELVATEMLERQLKVWEDTRLDVAVRWTALRQMYLQLRKRDGHAVFVQLNGPRSLVTMLKLITEGTEKNWTAENMTLLLESFLIIVYNNDNWRHENAADMEIYELLASAVSLVHCGSSLWGKIQSISATTIFLLAFNDMLIRKEKQLSICCTFYPRHILFPCTIMFYDLRRENAKEKSSDLLRSPVANMLIIHWNVLLAGGINRFLSEDVEPSPIEFATRLVMDDRTKTLLMVTHPNFGYVAACNALETAKCHTDALEAVDMMTAYLMLWPFLDRNALAAIPVGTESCFRYISVLPHGATDLSLLTTIAEFVTIAMEKHITGEKSGPASQWVYGIMADQRSLFVEAVRRATRELALLSAGRASLQISYVAACKSFARSAWRLFSMVSCTVGTDDWDLVELFGIFVDTLKDAGSVGSVDFGTLTLVTRCVMLFCGIPSVAKQPETISFVPNLINCLEALYRNSHEITSSFLGRAVARFASLALTNLVAFQLENHLFPALLESWKNEQGDLQWLIPLWSHRDSVVRAAGISITSALSYTKEGRLLTISCFKFIPGGIWNAALSFLFNEDEPDLVKYHAVYLLSVLLQTNLKRSDLVLREAEVELQGTDALCSMLDQLRFYHAVFQICQNFGESRTVRPVAEYLLGGVFSLCATLIKLVGRRAVLSLKQLKFFHSALHICFLVKVFVQDSPLLPDRMDMFCDLYAMLGYAVQCDESVTEIVGNNMHAVGAAFCLLDPDIVPGLQMKNLWINIYVALSDCLRNQLVLDCVWRFLSDYHVTVYKSIKACLKLAIPDPENQRLQSALLACIDAITATDRAALAQFLWKPVASGTTDKECVGNLITHFLLLKFGEPEVIEGDAWSELLKRFLLRYEPVRQIAMDSGFVETIIDLVLEIDSTISRNLHVHSRNVLKRKMAQPVRVCLELLMNLMFRNDPAKRLAAMRSLTSVLISLWITVINDTENLHILFLRFLCTYGAHCQESLSSFVRESEHHHTSPLTLFHVVIADLEEQLALPIPHPDITPLLFDLLGQMCLNTSCRVFVRKSISVKRAMPVPSPRKPKHLQALDAMWLHVLANLSFFEDGQIVILAKEDICSVLFDYLEIDGLYREIYTASMLILRNLSFCKKGMIRLIGARGVLAKLIRLSSLHFEPKVRVYALSCLLELLYDQVKLRHAAKAISFDELGRSREDDDPQMLDLRARLLAYLDDNSEAGNYDADLC